MARFVDSHCHLQHEAFNRDRQDVLSRALDQLAWLVVVGDDAGASLSVAAMAAEPSTAGRVFAIVGIHPHNASKADDDQMGTVRRLLGEPGVVALGEIGLDYHYEYSPRAVQRDVLRSQLEMAVEVHAPVVFHCREAEDDFIGLVEPVARSLKAGIMHCFGGDAAFARGCLDWGFYISFAGNVTFPKAKVLQESAAVVPLDRLLIETDSPFLAPQPVRGQRCEPVYVLHTARYLASLRNIELDKLAEITSENAGRAFSIPDPPHVPA
ncbi:MAG: TatD family hydrolase [Candidatus Hydrogenedentes bacterium]|nr:TatD family hydrolase [Candidatus Hydrogenedentota bacterium]